MVLEYATRLWAHRLGNPSDQVARIADIVGAWAQIPEPLSEGRRVGRRGATVVTEVLGRPDEALWAWRLRLSHSDDNDPAITWSVGVTTTCCPDVIVSVRLDRTRTDSAVLPPKDLPAPPKCITRLLDSQHITFEDGGRALGTTVWVVEPDEAEALAALILEPTRRLPIFGFTLRDDDPIDGGSVLPQVLGLAHVALMRSQTSWRLNDRVPRGFNVYGGAARLWWPGVTPSSNPWDHKLWTADVSAWRLQHDAIELIVQAGLTAVTIDPRVRQLERARREAQTRALIAEVEARREEYDEVVRQEAASARAVVPGATEVASTRLREAQERTMHELLSEREDALALAVALEQEAEDARQRAGAAEMERDYLRSEIDRLRRTARTGSGVELDDVDAALVAEIHREVNGRGIVEGARRRTFVLGPSFAATAQSLGEKYRAKILKACADVVIAAPGLLRRREDHPLRVGGGANDAVRVRVHDGAEAHRCYIEHNTPAARRLHYWALIDGSVEFASVNLHDDMAIPE
jgi:hypothetical protein